MAKGRRLTIGTANVELDDVFVRRHAGAVAGAHVSLTVKDTGWGMTPEVLSHVFEPFFTTKPQGQGTGLGLSTVYGIVKQNNGYITIDSSLNRGTAVTIFWPKNSQPGKAVTSCSASPSPALSGTETILLVEDEPGIRSLMRKILEPHGYQVIEAKDVLSGNQRCGDAPGADRFATERCHYAWYERAGSGAAHRGGPAADQDPVCIRFPEPIDR
jgi:hypothetical protein